MNEAIVEQARHDPGLAGMGTTLTMAVSLGTDLIIAHVGDSRIYLFRGGQLYRLTQTTPWRRRCPATGRFPHGVARTATGRC